MSKLGYTWQLMKASYGVLQKDKRLLLFPLLSGICCLLVMASFAVPIALSGAWHPPTKESGAAHQVAYYGTLFLYYFANYFVITFFNVGIVACAIERLRGGEPTIGYGFNQAMNRLPLIIGWSALAATIGLVLRIIEDRSEKVGQFVAGLLGVAWGIASYLVIPVLVVEGKNPLQSLKSSSTLLTRTWGERIVGGFGFSLLAFLLAIPGIALVFVAVVEAASPEHRYALAGTLGVIAALYFVTLTLVMSALQSIFQAAVYLFASGEAPAMLEQRGFPVQLLNRAMIAK